MCAALRNDEDRVHVGNAGRKPEWKLNFRKENPKKSRSWTVEECYEVRKDQKKKLLIRQAWAKNEFSSPEEKTSPPTSKNIYGEFIDIGKWNESS